MDYYLLCFIISLCITLTFAFKESSKRTVHMSLYFIFTSISILGLWQRNEAVSLEEAILATKISYIGECYSSLSIVFIILYLCKVKITKKIRALIVVISTTNFGICLTIGRLPYFYRNMQFLFDGQKYVLVKDNGILHSLFFILLFAFYAMCNVVLFSAIKKKKDISVKIISIVLSVMGAGLLCYIVQHLFLNMEIMPIWFTASTIIFFIIDEKLNLYSIDRPVIDSFLKQNSVGVVAFDRNYRYLGCNACAREIYPQLSHLVVDYKIDITDPELTELYSWIKFFKRNIKSEFYFKQGSKYYKVVFNHLYSANKIKGFQLMFTDCTEEKNKESNLIKISITDELTNLLNRRAYEEEINKIQSDGIPEDFAIISFDLNGLKKANDTKGHAAGDELIIASANCLNGVLEQYGYVYRTGGDEYIAIVLASEDQLKDAFMEINVRSKLWEGKYNSGLSISKGCASHEEFPDYTLEQLEKEAEQRMYKDKTKFYVESGIERRRV